MLDVGKTCEVHQPTNIQNPTSNILLSISFFLLREVGAKGIGGRQAGGNRGGGSVASGMAVAAGADLLPRVAIDGKVVDHVVAAGPGHAGRHIRKIQQVPHLPGDDVIGAGRVAADTQRADQPLTRRIEGQSAAAYVDAADLFPYQWIVPL